MRVGLVPGRSTGQVKPFSASLPQIDWSHPLANGLIYYGWDCGGFIIDLVSFQPARNGTPAPGGLSRYGLASNYNGTTQFAYGNVNAAMQNIAAAAPYSFAGAYLAASTPADVATVFAVQNNVGANPFALYFSTGHPFYYFGDGASNVDGGAVHTNDAYHSMLGVANQGGGSCTAYFDGVSVATGTNTTTSVASPTTVTASYGASGQSGNTAFFPGYIFYGAAWKRALSAADAFLLHRDPYCLLRFDDEPRTINYAVIGGGGTSYSGDVAETVTNTDTISGVMSWVGSGADTATMTDGNSSVLAWIAAAADTVTLTDARSSAMGWIGTPSETATLTDAASTVWAANASASETATLTDTPSSAVAWVVALSETATITDADSGQTNGLQSGDVAETVTVGGSFSGVFLWADETVAAGGSWIVVAPVSTSWTNETVPSGIWVTETPPGPPDA